MDLLNATRMPAAYTQGLDKDGREFLVVAVKGTFTIPAPAEEPVLAAEQAPLMMADTFTGQPGFSAPIYEADFAPIKRRCDVLLLGSAYAPQGKPAFRVPVSLQVSSLVKRFQVVGDRVWERSAVAAVAGRPKPFLVMPITYDRAFGGLDDFHWEAAKHSAYSQNPVGRGYCQSVIPLQGAPMPNTEEFNRPIESPKGAYRPMAFGPIGRHWEPRIGLGGTYDQAWLDQVFPFLPADFDEVYYQAAPPDQQMPYLQGGETVVLENLTPEGHTVFRIPRVEMPVVFFPKNGDKEETRAVIDTLIIEPDLRRFTLTWRVSRPLRKNMFEVAQVLVGQMPRGWWRARELGKTYYPSLAALSQSKRREALEESE